MHIRVFVQILTLSLLLNLHNYIHLLRIYSFDISEDMGTLNSDLCENLNLVQISVWYICRYRLTYFRTLCWKQYNIPKNIQTRLCEEIYRKQIFLHLLKIPSWIWIEPNKVHLKGVRDCNTVRKICAAVVDPQQKKFLQKRSLFQPSKDQCIIYDLITKKSLSIYSEVMNEHKGQGE